MSTKYTKEILQEAVDNSFSYAGVLRYLKIKQAGGSRSHIARMIAKYGIDTSHFTGARWNKGKTFPPKKGIDQILIVLPEGSNRPRRKELLRSMLELKIPYICNECGAEPVWNDKPLVLEINHIDGDWLNNLIENLEFLCPNCHSQDTVNNRPHKNRLTSTSGTC